MTKEKEDRLRIINFRAFFLTALFLLCAIFAALLTLNIFWAGVVLEVALLGIAVFFFIKYAGRKKVIVAVAFALCAVFALTVYISFIAAAKTWTVGDLPYEQTMTVSGMVESDVIRDGKRTVYLSKLTVQGRQVNGKLRINIYNFNAHDETLSAGIIVMLDARISPVKLVDGFKVDGYCFRNGIRYTCSRRDDITQYVTGYRDPGFAVNVRDFVRDKLVAAMGEDYGDIAYGMLTGDKAYIDNDVVNSFTAAGIRHILAVSGLHLGFVAAALTWLCKKLKARRAVTASVVTVFLLFYAVIAGFSPSVTRSAVMSLAGVLVYLFGRRRDMLSSLSLAFCLMLAFKPMYLFEAGFLISFGAVFGIVCFTAPIEKALRKIRVPRRIASSMALCTAVQIGIMPMCAFFFNTVNIYSLIVNLLVIPLAGVTFTAILISLLIAAVSPFLLPLSVSGAGIGLVDLIAGTVAALPYSRIVVYATPLVFVCYGLYFIMSRFFMLRRKLPVVLLCLILCVVSALPGSFLTMPEYTIAPIVCDYGTVSLMRTPDGVYVIGDLIGAADLKAKLSATGVRRPKAFFITVLDENIALRLASLASLFGSVKVYFPLDKYSGGVEYLDGVQHIGFEDATALTGGFSAVYEGGGFFGYEYSGEGARILFVPRGADYSVYGGIDKYHIIRADAYYPSGDRLYLFNDGYFSASRSDDGEYFFDYRYGIVYTQ